MTIVAAYRTAVCVHATRCTRVGWPAGSARLVSARCLLIRAALCCHSPPVSAGDTHEHYIPPRAGFQNRDTQYGDLDSNHYRVPAPGSQPEPNVPRGYPETEFDISLAKRPSFHLSAGAGVTPVAD